ncbi:MAG: MFS transporter, partial [Clostridia bacterium]|nr:MFS transporter [Clostridia bacterium]MBQ6892083.1 MFS transporter [Clostridia bacterium]MBQ9322682.1 MFS transporter [Clostridia bacterium]
WLVTFYLPTEQDIAKGANFYLPTGLIIFGILTILGLIAFICRIFDAVTDPWIASLSDRSTNPKGRRIPFMKRAAIPFALITVLVFFAPVNGVSGVNIAWVLCTLILFYLFMTMYCTPYNALISEFGKTQEDRMYISTAISLTFFFGTLIAYLPFVFAGVLQGMAVSFAWSYRLCFIVLSAIALVCMLVPVFKLNEKEFVDAVPSESNAIKSLGKTFQNKDFVKFAASDIAYWIGLTLFQTGLPFFVKVSMELDASFAMYFLGGMTVLSACFYPIVSKLVSKFGKKKLVITGFLGLALAYVVTALIGVIPGFKGIVPGALIVIISAFPMALLGIIPQAIVADVAEEDAIVTGEKREGMFFAARTFAMKMGQSVAMLVFTSLAVLGTTQDLKSNDLTASPIGLRIVAIVAICFCVLGAVILAAYDEKKVMKTITDNANK